MPDVCDGVGNWGTAAEHVINTTNLTGRRDTLFFDTIDHRQRQARVPQLDWESSFARENAPKITRISIAAGAVKGAAWQMHYVGARAPIPTKIKLFN